MGASASSVWYNLRVPHPCREAPILDYDLALLFQPMLMLGITVGVSLSVVFPYWLITVLIIILFMGISNHIELHFSLTVISFINDCLKCYCLVIGTSSRSFFKAIEMWKEETILKVTSTYPIIFLPNVLEHIFDGKLSLLSL